MAKYRKKPVVIDAYHLKDLSYKTVKECLGFMGQQVNTYRGIGIEQDILVLCLRWRESSAHAWMKLGICMEKG